MDGIMFMCSNDFRKWDNSLAVEFYRDVVVRLALETLSEPAYRGKLLGLGAAAGYVNWFTGMTQYENGTRTFRQSFETAMSGNPDFIAGFEWDDPYEGTYLQPSVYNSFTIQRLCRFYMSRVSKTPPAAIPGDNTSIPGLVISHRKVLSLGEKLDIEMLNIPDGGSGRYEALLELKNQKGETVMTFQPVSFDSSVLSDSVLSIASENFPGEPFLIPSVKISRAGAGDMIAEGGLPCVDLRATWNRNRKCVKTPVRDLLSPETCVFSASPLKDTPEVFSVRARFSCGEDIASAEVLGNNTALFAADASNEYGGAEYSTYYIEFSSSRIKQLHAQMTVTGAPFRIFPAGKWSGPLSSHGDTVKLDHPWILEPRGFYLRVPKDKSQRISLRVEMNGEKFEVPLSQVNAEKAFAAVFKDFLWFSAERFDKLPDMPPHWNKKDFSFDTKITVPWKNTTLILRVISKSGKIYWSRPLMVNQEREGAESLNVFSAQRNKVVTLSVDKSLIPDLNYEFNPERGAFLGCKAGREWFGEIGGGNGKGKLFHESGTGNYPEKSSVSAPQWVDENGRWILKFDGRGNYIFFPSETLPQGAFTLEMEIKPSGARTDYYLIKGKSAGSPEFFDLTVSGGKLRALYHGALKEGDESLWTQTLRMSTDLNIPSGQWSKIKVSYNLKDFKFSVNGKESGAFPFDRKSYTFKPFVFGGNNNNPENYFEGMLKSLNIRHNAGR